MNSVLTREPRPARTPAPPSPQPPPELLWQTRSPAPTRDSAADLLAKRISKALLVSPSRPAQLPHSPQYITSKSSVPPSPEWQLCKSNTPAIVHISVQAAHKQHDTTSSAPPSIQPPFAFSALPTASTSQLPFPATPPATPKFPRRRQNSSASTRATTSPGKNRRSPHLFSLQSLLPAGVVVLSRRRHPTFAASEGRPDEIGDGWSRLTHDSLRGDPKIQEQDQIDYRFSLGEVSDLPAEPLPASPTSSRKRNPSTTPRGSPLKRARMLTSKPLLDDILLLQDALLLRATYRVADGFAILRIYLVPSDLPERLLDFVKKTGKARPPDSTVLRVLGKVRTGKQGWEGNLLELGPSLLEEKVGPRRIQVFSFQFNLNCFQDKRSLLEIYRQLDSPADNSLLFSKLQGMTPTILDRLEEALTESPRGMKTDLFPYQRASLAKMLAREIIPQTFPSSAYLQTSSSVNGSPFFLGVGGDVRLDPPQFTEPKGGVLAEEMGTGKTITCLALILATRGELPNLSTSHNPLASPPLIMTSESRQFPFHNYLSEVKRLRPRVVIPILGPGAFNHEVTAYEEALALQQLEDALEPRKPIPSLRSLVIHIIKARAVPYLPTDLLASTGLLARLEANTPAYYIHPSPEQLETREGRKGAYRPVKILLSTTTLVVVPTDLVRQWQGEIDKHIEEGVLKYLVLRTTRDKFPEPEELVTYDAVILSVARFSDAADDVNSPLRKIHWKRLFVDEGHALSGPNQLRRLAEEIHCESFWAVSGTPTTNLRGADDEDALFAHETTAGGTETDYQRLGEIFCRFLKHPAWRKVDEWRHMMTVPILREGRGAQRLASVLDRSFVRNAPERIKQAYTLPSITSRVTYLDFLPGERRMYNSLLALFAANSIQSQRVDQDYFFAPGNKKSLDELTLNLSTSSVFFASSETYGRLWDAVRDSKKLLESDKSASWSEEDVIAQQKAIAVMQEALDDPEWRQVVNSCSVGFDVEGLQDTLFKTFSQSQAATRSSEGRKLMPSSGLVQLRTDLKEVLRPTQEASWRDDEELVEEVITFEERRIREMNDKTLPVVAHGTKPEKGKRKAAVVEPPRQLPAQSTFLDINVGSTTSVKINYVISEINAFPDDKFIIFSCTLSDLLFAQLSEAFDIVGIKHVIFAGHASQKRDRGATAAEFNTSPASKCRAILVDAKMGGRGMQLDSANRVIMLEPIWVPDLEVQAAKRAHRLGQTKPVDLQVLVITGSYEDSLLKRRGQLNQIDFLTTKKPQRDSKLSAQYLEPSAIELGSLPASLVTRMPLIRSEPVPEATFFEAIPTVMPNMRKAVGSGVPTSDAAEWR
ncbi:hypothetical protein P7C70_g2733, partial [Phenoliferia sp. Uapishka_3]